MALIPIDAAHALQIEAGTIGRKKGHEFEKEITKIINSLDKNNLNSIFSRDINWKQDSKCLAVGHPVNLLLKFICLKKQYANLDDVKAFWLGGLATSGKGDVIVDENGNQVTRSKSDVLLLIKANSVYQKIGISIKTCRNKTPTNDQLYFTTASAFCNLLRQNNIQVSKDAEVGLKMFCGDVGYRPIDTNTQNRQADPSRWFYEELPANSQLDLNNLFTKYQDEITTILLQKAYANDPYPPSFILHQTRSYDSIENCEVALFDIQDLVRYSKEHDGYILKEYIIRKGSFKHDDSPHLAPRFGFIQFQRGGQKQHPTQLQFNLKAGYFNKI